MRLIRLSIFVFFFSLVSFDAVFREGSAVHEVLAQGAPQGLSKLETKMNDVAALVTRILYIFVGLGILFCGFRFVQGDPHAWRYTLTVVVGACIIFASGEILSWLQQ
jgi:type IV secretory pathway VirB2 component (pilin)